MLKKSIAGMLLIFTASCFPIGQPNQIVVDGDAVLEFEPELFMFGAIFRSRGKTQAEVLAELSAKLSGMRETLPKLENLTQLTIDASQVEITAMQDRVCIEESDYRTRDQCPVTGYFGSVEMAIKGAPASVSGNAISLVSELGAEAVTLSAYSLADQQKAQDEALAAAVKDARSKAQKIAAAAGASITGPIRIQYGEGFGEEDYDRMMAVASPDTIVVTAQQRLAPEHELDLDPQKIKIEAKVTASFEIE